MTHLEFMVPPQSLSQSVSVCTDRIDKQGRVLGGIEVNHSKRHLSETPTLSKHTPLLVPLSAVGIYCEIIYLSSERGSGWDWTKADDSQLLIHQVRCAG